MTTIQQIQKVTVALNFLLYVICKFSKSYFNRDPGSLKIIPREALYGTWPLCTHGLHFRCEFSQHVFGPAWGPLLKRNLFICGLLTVSQLWKSVVSYWVQNCQDTEDFSCGKLSPIRWYLNLWYILHSYIYRMHVICYH